jgi:hypothetical protein
MTQPGDQVTEQENKGDEDLLELNLDQEIDFDQGDDELTRIQML